MRLYEDRPSGTVDRARKLRRAAPEPERRLLRALREASPTLKWRHQSPVGPYFADVLCFSEKLVIEVDGDTHADGAAHDDARAAFMRGAGFRTLRVANAEVMENLEGVLTRILSAVRRDGVATEKGAAA